MYSCHLIGLKLEAVCPIAQLLFPQLTTPIHCGANWFCPREQHGVDILHVTSWKLGLCPCFHAQPAFIRQTSSPWMLGHFWEMSVRAYPLIRTPVLMTRTGFEGCVHTECDTLYKGWSLFKLSPCGADLEKTQPEAPQSSAFTRLFSVCLEVAR